MKRTIQVALLLAATILTACDNDDDAKPVPTPELRVTAVSHGKYGYNRLMYDDAGRISSVISGNVDDVGDSVEAVFEVTYKGRFIDKIVSTDDLQSYHYTYANGLLTETREYVNGELLMVHEFTYSTGNKVGVWVIRQASGDQLSPLQRMAYTHDAAGNTVEMEFEIYDPITKGHRLVSTSKFMDFDDKKNSASLFLNFTNPTYSMFVNNARIWKVESGNGTIGETRYEYEYNDEGYSTIQRDLGRSMEIKYTFAYH